MSVGLENPVRPTGMMLSRRTLIAGGLSVGAAGALGWRAQVGAERGAPEGVALTPTAGAEALARGYVRLRDDLAANWFAGGGRAATGYRPGILPTNGSGGYDTGTTNNVQSVANGALWQTSIYAMFLAGDCGHPVGDAGALRRMRQELALLKATYSRNDAQHGLGSDGSGDGTINVSDDAAWKMQLLQMLHRLTGDASLVDDLTRGVVAINALYVDDYADGADRVANSTLPFSRFGMLYARPGQDPNGQGRATTYEVGTLLAALYVYGLTKNRAFLGYPVTVYESFRATLQRPSGIYYQTLQLDPAARHDSTPYRKPINGNPGDPIHPIQGYTGLTIGGSFAMALLAARLHQATGDDRYQQDAVHVCDGIAAEYLQNGKIICDSDPWMAGFYILPFTREVLSLPGADPHDRLRAALIETGQQIIGTRRQLSGLTNGWSYSAEWSGNAAPSIAGGYISWEAHGAAANGGRGGGQAGPQQIMTQASSGIVVQAAALLAAKTG